MQVKASNQVNIYFVFVPKVLQSILILLEEEGLMDKVHVTEFMWQLIPLDADLLSLEMPNFMQSVICQEDLSLLSCVSRSLFGVESLFGQIGSKIALGKKADVVLTQLKLLESAKKSDLERTPSTISHLVLIDRDFDLVSFLLSPVTYEALLDEVFDVSCGMVDFSQYKGQGESKNEKLTQVKLELSTKDKVLKMLNAFKS